MYRSALTAFTLFLLSAAPSIAQTKPDFSGAWKLTLAKSDFGVLPAPSSRTDVITHTEPTIKDAVTNEGPNGKQTYTLNYTTDGKEVENKIGPNTMNTTSHWDGSTLISDMKLQFNGQDVTGTAKWTLSADGKTLTQAIHYASAMGETDQTLVYEKQEGGAAAPAPAPTPTPTASAPANGPHPNFSGTWKLNVGKSDFGPLPPPDTRTDVIEQTGDGAVKLTRAEKGAQGDINVTMNMTTDGKEIPNTFGPGTEAKISSVWQGPALVSTIKLQFQGQDVVIVRTSTLSDDGKVLTANSHLSSPMGELDQKEVYEKQP